MYRRMAVLLSLALGFAVGLAPAADAQEPTIVTDITFGQGEPFGTFESSAPLCASGTFVDEFVGGGGAFNQANVPPYHGSTVRKTFTCADGSGTFTILFHPQFSPATPAGCGEAGPFAVVGGTGDFAHLRGHGDFCVFGDSPTRATETFTGTFRL